MERGGDQFIPRPERVAPGGQPPWSDLSAAARRFTMDELADAARSFAAPRVVHEPREMHRRAAVLLALYEHRGESQLVFIKRPETMSTHGGQIAFPGGTTEPDDPDLAATALREAQEEIGLDPSLVRVVAELDTISTVATPFIVTPFVGLVTGAPELVPDAGEVAAVLEVPLAELFDETVYREELWDLPDELVTRFGQPERSMHFYELPGETVWGATARIVTNLLSELAATRR